MAGPLLSLSVWVMRSPGDVEDRVSRAAGIHLGILKDQSWAAVVNDASVYANRIAIVVLARVYDSLRPALCASGLIALLAVSVHVALRHRPRSASGRFAAEIALFAPLAAMIALGVLGPSSYQFAVLGVVLFGLNFAFPIPENGPAFEKPMRAAGVAALVLGAAVGISHLLAPARLLALVAWCLRPNSTRLRSLAVGLGRASACLISLPVIALAVSPAPPRTVSPQVKRILDVTRLYDIEIDRPGNQIFVTRKDIPMAFRLQLDTLEENGILDLPVSEMEDIELDCLRREILHVHRDVGEIFILDADSLRMKRTGVILEPTCSGSTKLALERSSGRLWVSFEDNHLFVVDRDSLKATRLASPGNVNLLSDSRHGVVYANSERGRWIAAMGARSLKELRRVPSAPRGERMALSEKRDELYAPDAVRGSIWVYSTPDLRLLGKIPAQFGVRALAVDDEHGLLLAASVVTGCVEVIDLRTGKPVGQHYVGKFVRVVRADAPTRRAFITLAWDGMFVLDY